MPPLVLHIAPEAGQLTERWIDLQAAAGVRFEGRLLAAWAPGAEPGPHWLPTRRYRPADLAIRAMVPTRGTSMSGLAPWLRRLRPSLIHAHYGLAGASLVGLARALSVPLVTSFYGYDATSADFTGERWRRRYRRLFERGAAVLAEGPAMAARIEALGCPRERIHVIRLPADADLLERCEAPRADGFLVTAAGRFVEKKGFDTAIRAFARGLGDRDGARLQLLGGGPLEGELRALAVAEGVEKRVEFAPRMPFTEFMRAIARSHVAVYPSRTAADGDSEGGAPVTLIEAQWLGVPSIVAEHDDLPFVTPPEGSIRLDPRDVDGWARALRSLYDAPDRIEAMSAASRDFARRHHRPEASVEAREALYASVTTLRDA